MYCPKCGKTIDADSIFCTHCGNKIERKQKADHNDAEIMETSEESNHRDKYAGFWVRFGAFMVDYVIIYIIAILFYIYISSWSDEVDKAITVLFLILYHTVFLGFLSSTPGKLLFGLKVVDAKTKENISFWKAFGRSVAYLASSLFIGLGFLVIGFNKKFHQGWHDELAKTYVIHEKKYNKTLAVVLAIISFIIWISFYAYGASQS